MKKTVLTLLFLGSFLFSFSQKELWGVNKGADDGDPNSTGYKGNISKYDSNGQNPTIVHEFTDFVTGKNPKGKLFLASNGKLYGVTSAGGVVGPQGSATDNGLGVLYEYDLILDKYRVVHFFNTTEGILPLSGVIEPIVGKLYGTLGIRIFSYDLNTESITIINGLAGGLINNELMKASNGFLYGTTGYQADCPGTTAILPNYGTIFRVNTTTNTVQTVHYFKCNFSDGLNAGTNSGALIEFQPGKLLGTASAGFANTMNGLLFEFDTNTNTFTKKIDFDGDNLGSYPMMMVNNSNGKLYGVCNVGGTNVYTDPLNEVTYTNHWGTLFEYTPTTNVLNKLHDFGNIQGPPYSFTGGNPRTIMKTSTGNYFGISNWGLYMFNPNDNSVIIPTPLNCSTCPTPAPNAGVTESLIEICRKPAYHEFTIATYDTCVGEAFSFDVQNTNATSYVWKKDGVIVPLQTTGVLTINTIIA